MNILPVLQLASAAKDFLSTLLPGQENPAEHSGTNTAADFSKQLRQAAQIHDREDGRQAEDGANLNAPQVRLPLESAPVAPHSVNGVLYHVGEVGFTQQELAKLRDKLLKEGLTPKSLSAIEQLASQPHGATLGQLLALMQSSVSQTVPLTDDDKIYLQHFADKIDGSGTLGKNLLQLLENGRHKEAWDAIKSSLAEMPPQNYFFLEHGEAALLCKAFGISQEASLEILKKFSHSEAALTPEIFTALMMPAQQEILDRTQQDAKLGQALAKHLQPLIEEARLRSEKERQAAEGTDRRSKQSETLIRDRFMDKFHKDVAAPENDAAQTPRNAEVFGKQDETPGRKAGQPGKTEELAAQNPLKQEDALAAHQDKNSRVAVTPVRTQDESSAPSKPASGQNAGAEAEEWLKNAQRPREDRNGSGNSEHKQDTRHDSRTLLSRAEIRQAAHTGDAHAFSAVTMPEQPQAQGGGQNANPAAHIRQAMQQVEQASLNRLANGGQRLEIQLAPSELGAVTLILVSGKGGEISATIRSERTETAELVARHLDIIRVNLEEQGLKVDKLEVQNQTLNNRDNWQGMEQHNAMREEQERREHLERLRRLGRLAGDDAPQARDVQLPEHTAEISGHGLHLVA